MLQSLQIQNLTVFPEADLTFAPGLNVFVGENTTGKSHLLKAAYSVMATCAEEGTKPNAGAPTKSLLHGRLADKLVGVFRPESLGRLARRKQGRERCEIALRFEDSGLDTAFSFATQSKTEVGLSQTPAAWPDKAPAYLPTRELLTLYPGFVALYDSHYVEFEETWRDTCLLLGKPPAKGKRESRAAELMKPLEEAMEGRVRLENNGRFYLDAYSGGKVEMPLVAEGVSKLAMLAQLIASGVLLEKGYLFWDEPEANLNPALQRTVATVLIGLARQGIQVFLATHSLFLLRELEIQATASPLREGAQRYFALGRTADGVVVEQGDTPESVGPLALLDESLQQSDRYLDWVE